MRKIEVYSKSDIEKIFKDKFEYRLSASWLELKKQNSDLNAIREDIFILGSKITEIEKTLLDLANLLDSVKFMEGLDWKLKILK